MSNQYPEQNRSAMITQGVIFLILGLVCGFLSYMGFPLAFLLSLAAILAINKAISNLAFSKHDQSQYERYKNIILALLCLIFGSVSSVYDVFGVIFLVTGVIQLVNNKKQAIPKPPKSGSRATESSRQYSSVSSSRKASSEDIYTVDATEHNPYAKYNEDPLVKEAKSFMKGGAANPNARSSFASSGPYQQALNKLKADIDELDEREQTVSDFLDDFFAGSTVSKSRYISVIQSARKNLQTNYEKAQQAVKMFGKSEPTKERMEILNRYVDDSADIINKVEKVIDELITVQQNDVISDGDTLDGLLDDLARTTSYYQRSPYKKDSSSSESDSGSDSLNQTPLAG